MGKKKHPALLFYWLRLNEIGYLFGCKTVCFQHFSWFISVKEFFLKPKYMNICF